MIIELRAIPEADNLVSPDLVDLWYTYINRWSDTAARAGAEGQPFRWSEPMEAEVGEFLLHGLDRCMHSSLLRQAATQAETEAHKNFTMTVVRAFVDGLSAEGQSCSQYVDQILTSFGSDLDD
jgi:hypothetical protein